jgi:hypothetical protein
LTSSDFCSQEVGDFLKITKFYHIFHVVQE